MKKTQIPTGQFSILVGAIMTISIVPVWLLAKNIWDGSELRSTAVSAVCGVVAVGVNALRGLRD